MPSKESELAPLVTELTDLMIEHAKTLGSIATQVKIMWGIFCAVGAGFVALCIFMIEKIIDAVF